jgi:polar amino acid transport system substrate-binding protein
MRISKCICSKILSFVFIPMIVLSLILVAGADQSVAGDLELAVPGQLSAATEGTYPPYSMADEKGDLFGIEVGVIREICKRMGVEYKPVRAKWESILIGLLADQYDMTSATMGITAERQKKVFFGNAWVESGARLVVKSDSPIQKKEDVKGKSVGVLVASTWVKLAEALDPGEIKYYKSDADAIQDCINGNVDSIIEDAIGMSYMIKTRKMPLRVLPGYLATSQRGMAFKKSKPNLVKAYNKALAEILSDGTYEKITKEVIGFDPRPENPIQTIFE